MTLKPCPFCGSGKIKDNFKRQYGFKCDNCKTVFITSAVNVETARLIWNTRYTDPKPKTDPFKFTRSLGVFDNEDI